MSSQIQFKIVTPEGTVHESSVDQATLPVVSGQVTILPGHRSYIAALKAGEVVLKKGSEETHIATSGGFVEFNNNTLVVLADTAERADAIDMARAEAARKRAEALKKENEARTRVEGFISEYERHKAESARNAFERVPTA